MSMSVGVATLDGSHNFTGSGMALAIAQALGPLLESQALDDFQNGGLSGVDTTSLDTTTIVKIRTSACTLANGIAAGLVPYLWANAVAHVTVADENTIVAQTTAVDLAIL